MAVAPSTQEIYRRACEEGEHRLGSTTLQLVSRSFIAGFNIVFGIIALGVVHALVAAQFGREAGDLAGGIAFGIGLVFLIVGRSELFTEDFLDPVAAAIERRGGAWAALGRLWALTLVFNLVGGAIFVLIMSTEGALPDGASEPLRTIADEIVRQEALPGFVNAIAAGAILTLMTWLLQAVNSVGSRIAIAWVVGAFVAIGPFNHVVVTALHLLFGAQFGATVGTGEFLTTAGVATAGNVVGGLVFVTLTHLGQAAGARANEGR